MGNLLLYPLGTGAACRQAAACLARQGISLTDHVSPEVTHLLLDIPTRDRSWLPLLSMLPPEVTVIGGNLPQLDSGKKLDLLRDEAYLAQNAAITADCALSVARGHLTATFADTPVLVIGWGRIGKCLAKYLAALGAEVTVAARQEKDRAMANALGCRTAEISAIPQLSRQMGLAFNTVPAPLPECFAPVKIELASREGLTGGDVIIARGLPGIHAPQSSGKLIASRILDHLKEETE